MMKQKPAYRLVCVRLKNQPGCGWSGKIYFDMLGPQVCPNCNADGTKGDRRLRRECLDTRWEPAT